METVRQILKKPLAKQRPKAIPFWQYLPQVFVYPLRAGAFSTILLLAVLRLFDPLLGMLSGSFIFSLLFSALVHFVLSLSLYRYAVQVLLDTSEGKLLPPEYSMGVEDHQGVDQIKLQILLLGASILFYVFAGRQAGLIAALVLAFVAPAATMSLAIQRSLWLALNPLTWARVIAGFGLRYFILAALCLGYGLMQFIALALLPEGLPRWIGIPLFWWVSHYAIIASFHAMGYLVLEHHEEIGHFSATDVVLPKQRHQWDPDQALLDEIRQMAEHGQGDAAAKKLRQHLDSRGGTQVAHDLYRELLTAQGDSAELIRHARQYTDVLMAQGAQAKAVTMLKNCLDADPGYCPAGVAELRPLADSATKFGQHQLAASILGNWMRQFPKSKETPAIALQAARIMAEKLSDSAGARQLLHTSRERFPAHEQNTEISRYLAYLDTLQQ